VLRRRSGLDYAALRREDIERLAPHSVEDHLDTALLLQLWWRFHCMHELILGGCAVGGKRPDAEQLCCGQRPGRLTV